MRLKEYADRVEKQHVCNRVPWELTADWARVWDHVLLLLEQAAVHEHVALTCAKCELLGGLLKGDDESNVEHAVMYAKKFMPQYNGFHDLGRHKTVQSDLFTTLRNKPLHGVTPAGIQVDGKDEVIGWRIGEGPHLTFTVDDSLRIMPSELRRDFIGSVLRYADYLQADAPDPSLPGLPSQRWRRSFWMRFRPAWYAAAKWKQAGIDRGVFPRF